MSLPNTTPTRMQELLAAFKAKKAAATAAAVLETTPVAEAVQEVCTPEPEPARAANQVIDRYGKLITLNEKQLQFVQSSGREGNSGVLIGAAGTGKTTTQFAVTQELIQAGHAGILQADSHKHLVSGTPGIVICAYTRRAVANIKRNLPHDLQNNAITVHKLLEYQPVYYDVMDENTGESRTKMQFEATRHGGNPLPSSIKYIIVEESSMLGTDLYKELIYACPHNPRFIFLGDIQQLPPVFGPAILGFKLLELPVVELTEVYRQALESPIISLAHRILSGVPLPATDYPQWKVPGKLTIHPWKKKIEAQAALNTAGMFFKQAYDAGAYDTEEDIILIPFNKAFGTDELNKIIANHIAHKHGRTVYQVVAGFNKHHFSVGDKVLYDKEDATIIRIDVNPAYSGIMPVMESTSLDYWGYDEAGPGTRAEISDDGMDFLLAQVAGQEGKSEERVRQCSHMITLRMNDSDVEVKVDKASDVNAMLLGYCLTVHKSQGSEWRKVFFVVHQSHATMVQRELLYTAVTRAREELYVICEPETFTKGILSQRVKGNTLAEKAIYFQGRLEDGFQLEG
jgi:ATP-dependent exoDNAse (exonuclease V) alpha subunit